MNADPYVITALQDWQRGDRTIEEAAEVCVNRWSDPANPANRLKRPAKRTCANCEQTYISHVSILSGAYYCSDSCRDKFRAAMVEALARLNAQVSA